MSEHPAPEPQDPTEPEGPPDHIEPADAVPEDVGAKVIELHTERGALTLRPNQTELDSHQKAALVAIGIDVVEDPAVVPQIRPFMHMCQVKGLDPWAKEAYLIGRGQGRNRKYTMQTGIDGYRKMANSVMDNAGRRLFIRVKETLWTGQDDDDRTWYRDENGVMRRIWWDQWPASRGFPGAAKVVVEHYDDHGNVVETEGIASWSMYAPFTDEWTWHPTERGKKVYKTDPETGERIRTLNDMWAKGYDHMLAKCAEALAYRKAFPARMSGFYTHEEMHIADQRERERVANEARNARQQAYLASRAPQQVTGSEPMPVGEVAADVVQQMAEGDPDGAPHGQAPASTAPSDNEPGQDPAVLAEWLRDELQYQAGVLDHTVSKLAARPMRALRKNIEDFTAEELLPLVAGLRPMVVSALENSDAPSDEVSAYAALGPTDVVNLAEYLAAATEPEDVVDGEVVPEDDERLDANPEEPHEFVNEGGLCAVCGEEADYILHGVPD